MYLSIGLLYLNLLAILFQAQAQPLRHHLSLHYTAHKHHMRLRHQLSSPELSPSGELAQKVFSHIPNDPVLLNLGDADLRRGQDAILHTLPKHDERSTIRNTVHNEADT
ncbi:hypothetical protein N7G274_002112 [Stereocaulon virgatum]|uniref:Uncharacterized protein n=1 Tax=Stereocaulon virgatum TaxID=373712 RepID=A0ABR4AIT4_9LECA